MNKKQKIVTIAGATGVAAVAVIGGAFALFTDSTDKATSGKAGTVDVEATDLTLSNPDNINPGDYDPDLVTTYTPTEGDPLYDASNPDKEVTVSTTSHDLTFTITNNGTKSIRTRHTLVLSVKDTDGNYLDARAFQLYEDLDGEVGDLPSADEELTGKSYIADDDTVYTDASAIPEGTLIKAIEYRFTPDIFDGVGLQAETETDATVVKTDDDTAASKDYDYKLAMNMEAPNDYQGASVNIEATFEALQYRNTTQADWEVVSTQTFSAEVATTTDTAVPVR
jgi:hypothetical protein